LTAFARYGAENSVFALAKDLEACLCRGRQAERGKKIGISHLENLISDGKELAKLLKIEDRRFSSSFPPSFEEISIERKEIDKDIKIYETWALWRIKAYKEIESHGLLSLIECDYEAYNKGSIDANALVRKLYFSECLEKIKKIGITIDKMANLVGALISGKVFKKGKIAELNRAARAFDIYLTLQACFTNLITLLQGRMEGWKNGRTWVYLPSILPTFHSSKKCKLIF
jgi:hypothetical protein